MAKLLAQRLARTLAILLGVSILVFSLDSLIPGDPALVLAGENASVEDIERTRELLGLNRPVAERYVAWAANALRGDFGRSLYSTRSVGEEIGARLPVTLSLLVLALLIGLAFGIGAGIVAALNRGKPLDRALVLLASVGVALPNFWIGMLFVVAFAIHWRLLPATGYTPFTENPVDWLRHLVLPAVALSTGPAAELTRQVRGSVIDILQRDFVRTAIAKGLPRRMVIGKHVLKNTGVTVATVTGIQMSVLLGASVVVEQVFGLPGIGGLIVESVFARDLPIVQGIVLVTTVLILASSLLVDLSYGYFNPKMKL
jgi:peptide/nickel transport system permease protein